MLDMGKPLVWSRGAVFVSLTRGTHLTLIADVEEIDLQDLKTAGLES